MNKETFLSELKAALSGLPQEELREQISFYREMIEDRMEDGIPEEEAVAGIGTVEQVKEQILSEIPLARLVRENAKPKRSLRTWEIVLLVLGSPVWIPVLLAVFILALSVYLVIWAAVVCVYAAFFALAAGAVAGLVGIVAFLVNGNPAGALFSLGTALVCAGLAILLFFASVGLAKAVLKLTEKLLLSMKNSFVGKEG